MDLGLAHDELNVSGLGAMQGWARLDLERVSQRPATKEQPKKTVLFLQMPSNYAAGRVWWTGQLPMPQLIRASVSRYDGANLQVNGNELEETVSVTQDNLQ